MAFELDLKKINGFHGVKRRRGIPVHRNSLNKYIAILKGMMFSRNGRRFSLKKHTVHVSP